jgi:hypothetical protein
MIYPIRSYILATLTYIILAIFLCLNFKKNRELMPVSLEIEADIVGDINQHQHNSSFTSNKNFSKIVLPDATNNSQHQHLDKNFEHKPDSLKNLSQPDSQAQKIAPIYQPLPEIPEDLRYDFFAIEIMAKFFIAKSGEVYDVELVRSSDILRLNMILIKSLMKWRFAPQDNEKTEIIRVKFAVRE